VTHESAAAGIGRPGMSALELLLTRSSAVKLEPPAPSDAERQTIFAAAMRAPDHGRLRPWRFLTIEGAALDRLGELFAASLKRTQPAAPAEALARERAKAQRAPLVIVVVARIRTDKAIPEIEQVLSSGAAAQNIMLAAHALGYGAMWKTGGAAYEDAFKSALGLAPSDRIVGFLYLGTRVPGATAPPPDPAGFVTAWG
jgi:nitroreductase